MLPKELFARGLAALRAVVALRPLCAKSGPSLTIIIYVRNIFGLATKESSHPSMMATIRATTSAAPPTADIVGQRGHVRNVPEAEGWTNLESSNERRVSPAVGSEPPREIWLSGKPFVEDEERLARP